MDAWIIGLLVGGVVLGGLVVLLGIVVKSAATTAETAKAVLAALEDVRANTAPLASLADFDPESLAPHLGAVEPAPVEPSAAGGQARAGNGAAAKEPGPGAEEQRGKEG